MEESLDADNRRAVSHKHHKVIVFVAILLLVFAVAGLLLFNHYNSTRGKGFINDSKRIDVAMQSVVMVYSYDNLGNLIATGSGFIAYDDSTVITNNHVTAEAYEVKISTEQDHTYDISGILAYDVDKDLVLLKTNSPTGLSPLEFGTSGNLLKGDQVLAIGSPIGLKNTVSTGVLSGRTYDYETGMDILQITAPISHGSSGGALFDDNGKIIGITFAGYDEGQNINFAIPIEILETFDTHDLLEISISEYLASVNPKANLLYHSQFVDLDSLVAYPDTYDKEQIAIVGYVSYLDTTMNCFFISTTVAEAKHLFETSQSWDRLDRLLFETARFDQYHSIRCTGGTSMVQPLAQVLVIGTFDRNGIVINVDYAEIIAE